MHKLWFLIFKIWMVWWWPVPLQQYKELKVKSDTMEEEVEACKKRNPSSMKTLKTKKDLQEVQPPPQISLEIPLKSDTIPKDLT